MNAKNYYNKIMNDLCLEYLTIGTAYSEDTENWELKDMVAECKYQLSTYYEPGHCNYELKEDAPETWRNETSRLKRFIKKYEPIIEKKEG